MTTESLTAKPASGTCRLSIHLEDVQVDVVVPAAVPLRQLIPWLYDIAVSRRTEPDDQSAPPAARYLHLPGRPPLDPLMTAAEHGILDGTTLILASMPARLFAAPTVDASDAVLSAPPGWAPQWSRLAALLVATLLAGVAGFVAVPSGPGTPSLLLGATAAGTTALIAARVTRCGRAILMTCAGVCALIAATTLGGTLLAVPGQRMAIALAVLSIALLTVAGRVAVLTSGMAEHVRHDLDPDCPDIDGTTAAALAHEVLTALIAGTSVTVALGAMMIAAGSGADIGPGCAVVAAGGAVLLLRAREHQQPVRRGALVGGGTVCAGALFTALSHLDGHLRPWLCIAALGSALAATWLGLSTPRVIAAPIARRCLDMIGYLALASVLPLACWGFGLYDGARAMSLT